MKNLNKYHFEEDKTDDVNKNDGLKICIKEDDGRIINIGEIKEWWKNN